MEVEDENMAEDDVVEQILSILPPKPLMRFKCVSKKLYALINNPRFVAKHLSISMHSNRSTTRVLLKRLVDKDTDTNSETQEVFSLFKFRNHIDIDNDNGGEHEIDNGGEHEIDNGGEHESEVEDINIPHSMSLKTRGSSLHIIGHCNGIICLVPAVSGEVILWNPAIQEFKHLPPQPYLPDSPEIAVRPVGWPEGFPFLQYRHCDYMDALGFGHDPRSNDYKVVNIEFLGVERSSDGYDINLPPKTAVYTLSTNSWREIKTFSLETQSTILYPERFQMYFKGMCFWSGQERHKEIHEFDVMDEEFIRNIIILFDMGDELFHEMLLPDSLYDPYVYCYDMRLLVWNESIALFGLQNTSLQQWPSFGIWMMDEFGGPKSPWTKHISFELSPLTERPLAFLKSDEILMADTKDTNGRIFSYNLSTKKLEYHPIQSVQIDSAAVVYGNYSIVSILGGNKLENTDNAGFSLFDYSSFPSSHSMVDNEWHSYSVWAIPPDDVSLRIKKVMESLRSEFGGPEIEPHIPVVGSLRMTHEEVLNKFRSLQSCVTSGYKAKVNQVVIRSFYYQCVSVLIDSSFSHTDESFELWRATEACGRCFGFRIGVRPHLSLLYGNLTEEERKKAQEKVSILDESITSMSFPITRLALYKIDHKDKSLKSWEKIAEHTLQYFN